MLLHIRNMVCTRCKLTVQATLMELGIEPVKVELGEVEIDDSISDTLKQKIDQKLREHGFALIDDRKSQIIEKIKTLVVQLIQETDNDIKQNLSDYLSEKLHLDYTYISNLYTQVEGTTIEQYLIAHKIEKVKELLVYDELTLTEIADRLKYSSVAYLSSQFKRVTGLTPSYFKKIKGEKRIPIDTL